MSPDEIAGPVRWLGETTGFWIQTVLLLISAAAGIGIIAARGSQEKRRATVDLIIAQKRDVALVAARKVLLKLHEKGEKNLAKYLDNTACEEYQSILAVLNSYEFVASGIREGAFHEGTYKRLRYFQLRTDWDALCGFVLEFQRVKASQTLFQEFRWLNTRWVERPLKPDHPQTLTL